MRNYVCRQIGIETQAGTDWPVELHVYRHRPGSWICARVCNGVARWHKRFRTRWEALEMMDAAPVAHLE